MKARTHTFAITVTFDKNCTASHALREVKDSIHGEFYPTQRSDDEPGLFRVKGFSRVRPVARKLAGLSVADIENMTAQLAAAKRVARRGCNLERPLVGGHE